LRRGDIILEINRKSIKSLEDYYKLIQQAKPGKILLFLVRRQDMTIFIPVQVPSR